MRKKKNAKPTNNGFDPSRVLPRKITKRNRESFAKRARSLNCIFHRGKHLIKTPKLDPKFLRDSLAFDCPTIEHQIIALRDYLQLKQEDFSNRYKFSKLLLNCIKEHHDVTYEGILFGSTTNGLGFRDSDVDLRLRPLKKVKEGVWEPEFYSSEMVERVLSDIAFRTTLCSPADGSFVPSSRCPIAKLKFFDINLHKGFRIFTPNPVNTAEEGLNYDISLSSEASLSTFNSYVLRFLCHLQPKFHLLATVLRYWSNVQHLIQAGYLSSYALVNMLIHFCQTVDPPLLPTYDMMRDKYFQHYPYENILDPNLEKNGSSSFRKAITRREYNCLLCLRKETYPPSTNTDPLGVLLLKFFEFYLNFPYSTHIINTRLGRALTHKEYEVSNLFHPGFPIKQYLNVQDPFDLKHNLTSGMTQGHFKLFLKTIRYSYERLFQELMNNFCCPIFTDERSFMKDDEYQRRNVITDPRNWGLNSIFVELERMELDQA